MPQVFESVEEVHPDLSAELFRAAITRAYQEHGSFIDGYAPPSGLGQAMYAFVTQNIREQLSMIPGWRPSDQRNIARITHGASGVSIICSGGDEFTGRSQFMPSTRSAKGSGTSQLVGQLSMFDPETLEEAGSVWYLLYYVDRANREIRCELSLPARIASGSSISEWKTRIILPSVPFGANFQFDAVESTEPVDISIEFKKAV